MGGREPRARLTPAWQIWKNDRAASCDVFSHQLGWELRLAMGQELLQSRVVRSEAELNVTTIQWREAMRERAGRSTSSRKGRLGEPLSPVATGPQRLLDASRFELYVGVAGRPSDRYAALCNPRIPRDFRYNRAYLNGLAILLELRTPLPRLVIQLAVRFEATTPHVGYEVTRIGSIFGAVAEDLQLLHGRCSQIGATHT